MRSEAARAMRPAQGGDGDGGSDGVEGAWGTGPCAGPEPESGQTRWRAGRRDGLRQGEVKPAG